MTLNTYAVERISGSFMAGGPSPHDLPSPMGAPDPSHLENGRPRTPTGPFPISPSHHLRGQAARSNSRQSAAPVRLQLHSKQNPNKQCTINNLSNYPVRNQCVFQKCVEFSATQTLEMFNLKQPKPPPQVAPMVRVAKNHNLLIDHFARFVTT